MHIAVGMLALAFLGPGTTPASEPSVNGPGIQIHTDGVAASGPLVDYEVRFVTVGSLDWRGHFDSRLRVIARQGGSAIWSADGATVRALLLHWSEDARSNILQAPRATTPAGGKVRVVSEERIRYVSHLERLADGPVGHATRLAYKPEVGDVPHGIRVIFSSCRPTPEGLLARIAIEDNRVVAMHIAHCAETLQAKEQEEADGARRSVRDKLFRPGGNQRYSLTGTIQVPELSTSRAEGEWLIPRGGGLVVSLGPHTNPGWGRKDSVIERLVLITGRTSESGERIVKSGSL